MKPSSPADWLDPQGDPTPVLDPEAHMLEMAARRGHNKDVVCPQVVVGGFIDLMTAPMVKATRAVDSNVHPHLKLGTLRDCPIGVATIPVGAARAVAVLEELIALGARTILIAGATGSLQSSIGVGDYVIPTEAVREEGVSFHYAPPSEIARANGIATRTLISAAHNSSRAVHTGSVWTTDALYREFTGKIRTFANQGVLGVDMETSALMIVAEFRRVELGIILTVSDLVYRNDWPNIFGTDVYQDNCVHMADIVMQAIGELLETTGRV